MSEYDKWAKKYPSLARLKDLFGSSVYNDWTTLNSKSHSQNELEDLALVWLNERKKGQEYGKKHEKMGQNESKNTKKTY